MFASLRMVGVAAVLAGTFAVGMIDRAQAAPRGRHHGRHHRARGGRYRRSARHGYYRRPYYHHRRAYYHHRRPYYSYYGGASVYYYVTPPTVYVQPPVVYSPPPVVYSQPPVVYSPPPTVYSPPPVTYATPVAPPAPPSAGQAQPTTVYATPVPPQAPPVPVQAPTVVAQPVPLGDDAIHAAVANMLVTQFPGQVRKLKIEVKRGEVEIDGKVYGRPIKYAIEQTIYQIPGVRKVDNDLHVKD